MTIKSMTGYGRGVIETEDTSITIEMKSVNSRFLETNIRIPRDFSFLEQSVRDKIQLKVARGKVDVFIMVESKRKNGEPTVNMPILNKYAQHYKEICRMFPRAKKARPDIVRLMLLPDVLIAQQQTQDPDEIARCLMLVLDEAVQALVAMRSTEGTRIADDVLSKIAGLSESIELIKGKSETVVEQYRNRLKERVAQLLDGESIDENRLLTEITIFAEKSDIDEELVRFHSHLEQFKDAMLSGDQVGRRLDFLLQELNRETNTIGSKSTDIAISTQVVDIKVILEKMREQAQNVE